MKNLLKISLAGFIFSLAMMLSPTQINANYISSSLMDTCSGGGATCECTYGCKANGDGCECTRPIIIMQ